MEEAKLIILIGGLTECFKIAGVPSKYLPIIAAIVGSGVGYLLIGTDAVGVFTGTALGLVTAGVVNKINYYYEK